MIFFIHLKEFIISIFYILIKFLLILLVSLFYSSTLTHFLIRKIFFCKNLIAIHFYELLLSSFSLIFYITIIILLLCAPIDIILYLKKGLQKREYRSLIKKYRIFTYSVMFDNLVYFKGVGPLILTTSLNQFYTYNNITNLIIKFHLFYIFLPFLINSLPRGIIYILACVPFGAECMVWMIVYIEVKKLLHLHIKKWRQGITPR